MTDSDAKTKATIKKLLDDFDNTMVEIRDESKAVEETQKPKIEEIKAKAKALLAA